MSEEISVQIKERLKALITNTKVQPREYQFRLMTNVLNAVIVKKAKSVMLESPVGSGKSIMGLLICKYLEKYHNHKFIWTAMRKFLLNQAYNENIDKHIMSDMFLMSMFSKDVPSDQNSLCIDECQHDSTQSMATIHNKVKPKLIFGLSGTPFRTDKIKLCFEIVIKDFGIFNLIRDGYLSKFQHFTIPEWSPETVCKFYLREPETWGKSLMYFHRLEQCFQARNILYNNGITCEVVTGNSNVDEQIDNFKEGRTNVIINCMKLTEGFDCPSIKTVFAKPSCKGSTIQMCGRVLRPFPAHRLKQIVQPKVTPWPFLKTAMPEIQWLWEEEGWKSLTPNTEKIMTAYRNVLLTLPKIDVQLPKFLLNKQKPNNYGRFRGRGRRR